MPLVPGRRGAFGDWLRAEREKRYRTQADALADYRRLAGLAISTSEYAQWESGSRVPKTDNPKRLGLYAFYGSREDAPPPAPSGQSDVAAAIDRQTKQMVLQTAAISELAEQLRAVVLLNVDLRQDVAVVVGRLLGSPLPGEGPSATPDDLQREPGRVSPPLSAGTK